VPAGHSPEPQKQQQQPAADAATAAAAPVIDFDSTTADVLKASKQAKQALVKAKLAQHSGDISAPAAPKFQPRAVEEDEDSEEFSHDSDARGGGAAGTAAGEGGKDSTAGGGTAGLLAGLWSKLGGLSVPPVAQAFKLELRPLEGAEHFFDEPYNDYYFYYADEDGNKVKGGSGGEGSGKHVRPAAGGKGPAGGAAEGQPAQQQGQHGQQQGFYEPYDDPEDNIDEFSEYDVSDLLLEGDGFDGDSLEVDEGVGGGAAAGQQQQGSADAGKQQQPRGKGTAEL
jgi:hypothetical protein